MQEQKAALQNHKKNRAIKISDLPPIPEKLYFSIGEASRLCAVQPYVLRYWEQEFPQISPSKRRYNRRYYQKKDILLLRKIKFLLYEKGFTIDGARAQLNAEIEVSQNEMAKVVAVATPVESSINFKEIKEFFKDALRELDVVLYELEAES